MARHVSPPYLTLVVNNERPTAPGNEDAALQAFCEAQARWLKTRRKEDAEVAEKAHRAFVIASGGDPDKAKPLHGWQYVQ